jgi:Mn-dependent DtxR family transcriptional regulator
MSEDEKTARLALENEEECLEALCRLEKAHKTTSVLNLAENSDLAGKPLTNILLDLAVAKDILLKDKAICLTEKGRSLGKNIIKKHELAEKMLRLLGLRKTTAHQEACKLEHILTEVEIVELNKRLATLTKILAQKIITLDKAEVGKIYTINLIKGSQAVRRRLEDLGLGQGASIKICNLQPRGPIEIEAHGACTALGQSIAAKVLVIPMPIKTMQKKV